MQSRRDQIHSYQFFLHRVISGLVSRQSDPAELPFRRLGGAALGSVMVAALALAVVGVYGVIVGGGSTSWRKGTFVIVVKDTGARYVFRNGRLHPVVNFTSARLVLGRPAKTKLVSAKSLRGVPRGPQLGIPGAPDTLPASRDLARGDWILCSTLVANGRGGRVARTTLAAGVAQRVAGTAVTDQRATLVREPGSGPTGLHLLWNNHRFPIDDAHAVLPALGVRSDQPFEVAPAWLDALPPGPTIGSVQVADVGTPTTALGRSAGVLTGQVVEAPPGTFYLVRPDRLEPITTLQKEIVFADKATAKAYGGQEPRAVQITTAAVANAAGAGGTAGQGTPGQGTPGQNRSAPPSTRPELITAAPAEDVDGAACAVFTPGRYTAVVKVGARLPAGDGIATPGRTPTGGLLADRVLVASGRAVLAQAVPTPEATGGSFHLVTDQGIRYPLAAPEVARMLGYNHTAAVRLPSTLLDRLPAGPALDPVAAARPAG